MKGVWSYWYPDNQFVTSEEIIRVKSMAVSLHNAKRQFSDTELITTSYGKTLVQKWRLPFDTIKTDLDQFNEALDKDLWAFIKIYACSIQKGPFVHIDNDLFLYSKLDDTFLQSDMFFESRIGVRRYDQMISWVKHFDIEKELLDSGCRESFSFGVIGCNNLEVIADWYKVAHRFIFSNKDRWHTLLPEQKHYLNQLFELYFLSVLIHKRGLKAVTLEDLRISTGQEVYRHLYGPGKNHETSIRFINAEYDNTWRALN